MATYTVYKINLDGTLGHKEHLNNKAEMADWVNDAMGLHASIRVENDRTREIREFTDCGGAWDRVA